MSFTPSTHPGTIHHYAPRLIAFEHTVTPTPTSQPQNTLLFLGGLGDGIIHPLYPSKIAANLPSTWRAAEVQLSSSYGGWTTSNLEKDAKEVEQAVAYFHSLAKGKIVLMGHSTGSQICMEYLTGASTHATLPPQRPSIDGVILQAGVSDREFLVSALPAAKMASAASLARNWAADGRGGDVLPLDATDGVFGVSPSAQRWLSLAEKGGDDDFFSSDLDDSELARTFGVVGKLGTPVLCLLSGSDEYMPDTVDKDALLGRWCATVKGQGGTWSPESGAVKGAGHNLMTSGEEVVSDLVSRVVRFLNGVS